jgi:plastocyanin domain-containing protein
VAGDVVQDGVQRVTMRVLGSSFNPAVIKVKAGIPVEWTIIGENPSGCTSRLLLPNMEEPLPIAKGSSQTIRFTADKSGTIPFSCWMGMVRGKIVVD